MLGINKFNHRDQILVLAAHPDDEVLGSGGTLATLAQCGATITPIFFCESSTVRYGNSMHQALEEAAIRCAQHLGIEKPVFLRLPDQKLDTLSLLDMAKTIERLIQEYEPPTIFTHHAGDINKDHRVVFEATLVAARPVPGQIVKQIYAYETISSTEWGHANTHPVFRPNIFVNISQTIDIKIKAFQEYKSEGRNFPHPRSPEAIRIRAQDWGVKVGVLAAEAFEMVRLIV